MHAYSSRNTGLEPFALMSKGVHSEERHHFAVVTFLPFTPFFFELEGRSRGKLAHTMPSHAGFYVWTLSLRGYIGHITSFFCARSSRFSSSSGQANAFKGGTSSLNGREKEGRTGDRVIDVWTTCTNSNIV